MEHAKLEMAIISNDKKSIEQIIGALRRTVTYTLDLKSSESKYIQTEGVYNAMLYIQKSITTLVVRFYVEDEVLYSTSSST